MAKYYLAFVSLAFIAIFVQSHPSQNVGDNSDLAYHANDLQQVIKEKALHHRKHQKPHTQQNKSDPNREIEEEKEQQKEPEMVTEQEQEEAEEKAEEEAEAALNHLHHLQRHFKHQREREVNQLRQYRKRQRDKANAKRISNPLRLPRYWLHLQQFSQEQKLLQQQQQNSDEDDTILNDGPDLVPEIEYPTSAENKDYVADENTEDRVRYDNSMENELVKEDVYRKQKSHSPEKKTATVRCPKCESNRQVEHVTEQELTQLRIEFVKKQILEKLRLKERPKVSAMGLPKPISDGIINEQVEVQSKSKELDDYYARTSKKFIFLEREHEECNRIGVRNSLCFSFEIDNADADGFDVNTATLWIFKNKQKGTAQNSNELAQQTIVVSEVLPDVIDSDYLPKTKTIAIQSANVEDEWMKINIEVSFKRWFGKHELSHIIHISCESCDLEPMEEWLSTDKDYRPFIMVDTFSRRRRSRQKRSINCTDGVTECCREKLYISFEEIGWGDWIIQPRGYNAYFCRGSCGSVASVTQSSSHHSTFLQKVMSTRRGDGRKPLEIVPCCTAKQYSSLQLVFMDSNNTATQKTFPNMIVESCGCR